MRIVGSGRVTEFGEMGRGVRVGEVWKLRVSVLGSLPKVEALGIGVHSFSINGVYQNQ